ncbi:MAG: hypothetical protein RIQ79_2203, partial [Verrucomicrobiota bacterium]
MSRRLVLHSASLLALALLGTVPSLRAQSDAAALTPSPAPLSHSSSSARTVPDDDYDDYATVKVSDPLEGLNRRIFNFNDTLYTRVLAPAVKGYEFVVRPPVNRAIANFY